MTERLPLFPLGMVLFPGLVLPLHVFEERYRTLMKDLAAGQEPYRFGVVAVRDGQEVAPTGHEPARPALAGMNPDPALALAGVGCVAEVASLREQPDGTFELLATGTTRFAVRSVDATGPYLTAEAEPLPEQPGEDPQSAAERVGRIFRTYRRRLVGAQEGTLSGSQELPDDPSVLSYLVAAASVLPLPEKQALLEAATAEERLEREVGLLRREAAVLAALPSLPAVELTRAAFHPN